MKVLTNALLLMSVVPSTLAADHHVPADFSTIQAAIDAAAPGDAVIVADGVWTGVGNVDLDYGGKAIVVRSANGAESCIIDCQATPEDPHRGVVFSNGETAASVFEGFTVRNGATPPGAILDEFNGGAILCNNGSDPTIRACILRDNHAGCWGGAICCTSSSPRIERCTILDNIADDDGGGVFSWAGGCPVIVSSVLAHNTAAVSGGGLAAFDEVVVVFSTISENHAPFASGVHCPGPVTGIANSVIYGNTGGQNLVGEGVVRYCNVEGGFPGDGNIDLDPGFAAADYSLSRESACVGAGDPQTGLPTFVYGQMTIDVPEGGIAVIIDNSGDGFFDITIIVIVERTDIQGDPRLIGWADVGADELRIPGDVDLDGAVDVEDVLAVVGAWGPCEACAADLNGDSVTDILDLLTVLADFG